MYIEKRISKRINKRGSLFVEAAIVLPIFILAILSICTLIRIAGLEGNTMRCFAEESQTSAKELYLTRFEALPQGYVWESLLHGYLLEFRTDKRINSEEIIQISDLKLKRYDLEAEDSVLQGIVNTTLGYKVEVPLPAVFKRELKFQQSLCFRGFVGAVNQNEGLGFEVMERPDSSTIVFIFPRAGERYHKMECRVIEVYPRETTLTRDLRKTYSTCKLCMAEELPLGSRVYCFLKSGKVFHKGSCTTVDRYVIAIETDEAIEKGYSPCYYCGGGN